MKHYEPIDTVAEKPSPGSLIRVKYLTNIMLSVVYCVLGDVSQKVLIKGDKFVPPSLSSTPSMLQL